MNTEIERVVVANSAMMAQFVPSQPKRQNSLFLCEHHGM